MAHNRAEEYAKEVFSRVQMILDMYDISEREKEVLIDVIIPLMDELFKLGAEYERKGYSTD